MIEDKELRDIFKLESDEHLQHLNDGLLRLESEPENKAILEEVFREAHSLKGASRMINLTKIENLSHHMEDIIGSSLKGEVSLTPSLFDTLYHALDVIRVLVKEAVDGVSRENVPVSDILELLKSRGETRQPQYGDEKAEDGNIKNENPGEEEHDQIVSCSSSTGDDIFRIESIRVETKKLDDLMTLVGELNVTRSRTVHRLSEMEEALVLWDGLCRKADEVDHELSVRMGDVLNRLKNGIFEDSSKLDLVCGDLEEKIRTTRLLPMNTLFRLFPRMIRDISKERGMEAGLAVTGGETRADKRIIEEMKDPLMHIIRNAIDHGLEEPAEREKKGKPKAGTICLGAFQTGDSVIIEVADDGKGMNIEAIRQTALKMKLDRKEAIEAMNHDEIMNLVFRPGFSTSSFVSDLSGRGVGLDVVRANVDRLKGIVRVESVPGQGTCFRIQLPVTLATIRVMIAAVGDLKYGLPLEYIEQTFMLKRRDLFKIEGRETIRLDGAPVSVVRLFDLLELPLHRSNRAGNRKSASDSIPCVIISSGGHRLGLIMDEMLDEQEVVLKPQSRILKKVRNVSGTTILGTGEICMILAPQDIIRSVRKRDLPVIAENTESETDNKKKTLLAAEDSLTTRTQMKRILEGAGYEVVTAVDGMDAYNKLGTRDFDALITDVIMPNMDGLTLTAKVREDRKYSEMPIILVTSLALDEDRKKGVEAGANAYITKPGFDQKVFLDTLKRLV
ncbi:hybrid sensor histidine kinase/response regulator [Desulforegula conservatrix]|uniref:hybrid sensor histidine kinase/response regulator n=1 Tax=Desulforegula conservatrix TaxID=153026 RepID=UPI0003F6ABE4|nr:hybrid sensor histidine kinase/response regulator [Desulforegula conservatrix]